MFYWGSWIDYKLPGWAASTAYAVGELVAPGNGHKYYCISDTSASGAVSPTFPTGASATVVDGGVTWEEAGLEATYNGATTWNGGTYAGSSADHFAQNVGKKPSVARFGAQWLGSGAWLPFSTWSGRIDAAWTQGMITLLDWDNWDLSNAANNQSLNYANVLNTTGQTSFGGVTIDSFLNAFAAACAAYAKPFIIRMWHEQNVDGGWSDNNFPWAIGAVTAGGHAWTNTAAQHIATWQKVIGIFRANGATNVAFMWCPNIEGTTGKTSVYALSSLYPGSTYVDWLAMDSYASSDSTSWTFQQIFRGGPGLQDTWGHLLALDSTKPICIAETNANPNHNFAARGTWYQNALETYAPDPTIFPNLAMLCWFMWGWSSPADLPVDQDGTGTLDNDFAPFKHGISGTTYLAGGTFTMPPSLTPIGFYDVTREATPFATAVQSTSTPMAWWKLNEAAGSTTAVDSSGRSHPGTMAAGVTMGSAKVMPAPGAATSASFNGSSTTGYIEVPNHADLSLAGLADAGIITSFIAPNFTVLADLLGKGTSGQYEYEIELRTDAGVEYIMYDLAGNTWLQVTAGDGTGSIGAVAGVPNFVGFSYNVANSPRAHGWLNPASINAGVASSDFTVSPVPAAGTSVLRIGQRPDAVRPLTSGALVGPTVIFSPAPNTFSMTQLFKAWNAAIAAGTLVMGF